MNKNKTEINKQSGFNLMELLFALVVIGGMVIGIVAMYNKNQNTSNARTIASDLQTLSSGVKSSFSSDSKGFDGLTNAVVSKLGLVPSTISDKAGKMTNKYGGDISIKPGSSCGTAGEMISCFTITETKLPAEVANKVLTQLGSEGMVAIAVNNQCIFSSGAAGSADTAPCAADTPHPYSSAELATALSGTPNVDITIGYGQ